MNGTRESKGGGERHDFDHTTRYLSKFGMQLNCCFKVFTRKTIR